MNGVYQRKNYQEPLLIQAQRVHPKETTCGKKCFALDDHQEYVPE